MIPLAGDVGAYEVEVEQRFPKCFQVPFFFLSEGSHQQRIIFFLCQKLTATCYQADPG